MNTLRADCIRPLDNKYGLLVIAGPEVVKAYDGKAWRTLIAPYLD